MAVEFHVIRKKIQGTDYTFQVWDLGGQKHFREMGVFTQYCKGIQGAIVCFDLTDIETLYQISKWMEFIPRNIPIILVGTKADLVQTDYFVKEGIMEIQNHYIIDKYLEVTILDFRSVERLFDSLLASINKDSPGKLIKSSSPIAL
ncbi:MAG: ADP-ribosylation factor-like protein [Candidatus Hodarchaeales archaeon]